MITQLVLLALAVVAIAVVVAVLRSVVEPVVGIFLVLAALVLGIGVMSGRFPGLRTTNTTVVSPTPTSPAVRSAPLNAPTFGNTPSASAPTQTTVTTQVPANAPAQTTVTTQAPGAVPGQTTVTTQAPGTVPGQTTVTTQVPANAPGQPGTSQLPTITTTVSPSPTPAPLAYPAQW